MSANGPVAILERISKLRISLEATIHATGNVAAEAMAPRTDTMYDLMDALADLQAQIGCTVLALDLDNCRMQLRTAEGLRYAMATERALMEDTLN